MNDKNEAISMFKFPCFYLSTYFSNLRTEIDIAFVKKFLNESDLKLKEILNDNWTQMIKKVDLFETNCINYYSNAKNLKEYNESFVKNSDFIIEKQLLLNKTLIFLNEVHLQELNLHHKIDFKTTSGKLIVITNEYIGKNCVEIIKK